MNLNRLRLRRKSVMRFVAHMAALHPELRSTVEWDGMLAIAARQRALVRAVAFPPQQKARTVRFGEELFIQVNAVLPRGEQLVAAMHELCHIWRDDPGTATYYSDELTGGSRCEFADIFAWYVTSPARPLFDPSAQQIDMEI